MNATRTASGFAESDAIHPAQLRGAELPEDWRWEKLGDVCKTTSGGTPSRTIAKHFEGNIPWVKSGELPDGVVSEIEEHITEEAIRNSSAKLFPAGTLLIALYGATVGKLGILSRNATTNQAVCGIFPPDSLDRKYLFWYLRFVRSDLIAQAIGGAQPNISQGILKNLLLPIAPPVQQEQIVAEIEKQFSRLDEAVASLKRTKANLKRYKAAVLKAAVEGKDIGKERKEVALETVCDKITDGEHQTPRRHKIGHMLLSAKNIRDGFIDYLDHDLIGQTDFDKCRVRCDATIGDVLVVCVGATIGRAAIVCEDIKFALVRSVALLRPSQALLPKFLLYWIQSDLAQKQIAIAKRGSAQPCLYLNKIRGLLIAVPSLDEQRCIVAEVERRLSVIDELDATVEANFTRAERMRQSILACAFSGRLAYPPGVA